MGPSREVRSGAVLELDRRSSQGGGWARQEARTNGTYKITSRIDDYNVYAM